MNEIPMLFTGLEYADGRLVPAWSHPGRGLARVGLRAIMNYGVDIGRGPLIGKTIVVGPYRMRVIGDESDMTLSFICVMDNGRFHNAYWRLHYWLTESAWKTNVKLMRLAYRAGMLHPRPGCIPSWRDFGLRRSRAQ